MLAIAVPRYYSTVNTVIYLTCPKAKLNCGPIWILERTATKPRKLQYAIKPKNVNMTNTTTKKDDIMKCLVHYICGYVVQAAVYNLPNLNTWTAPKN